MKTRLAWYSVLFGSLILGACGGKGRSSVVVDGSSTVAPITQVAAENYENSCDTVKLSVAISGTGGGFKRFSRGQTDISDASRPIKPKEHAACNANGVSYLEIPIAYDGLTVVVNKKNDWVKSFSRTELRRIFESGSALNSWKDLNSSYPDLPFKFYIPGTDSGTFDYFKEVVFGQSGDLRSDPLLSVSEDDNILVRGVSGDRGGLGFFGCAYYFANQDRLRAVPIDGGEGPVLPGRESIESGRYHPFSRPLFIYVNARSMGEKPEVKGFVDYYLENAGRFAVQCGYVPLPDATLQVVKKAVEAGKLGSRFLDQHGQKKSGSLSEF